MNTLSEKLSIAVSRIEMNRGPFLIFGLFLRDDDPEAWDVIASAPWLDSDRMVGMKYLAVEINAALDRVEMLSIYRIVPMDTGDESVRNLADRIGYRNVPFNTSSFDFAGAAIRNAIILSANGGRDGVHGATLSPVGAQSPS